MDSLLRTERTARTPNDAEHAAAGPWTTGNKTNTRNAHPSHQEGEQSDKRDQSTCFESEQVLVDARWVRDDSDEPVVPDS